MGRHGSSSQFAWRDLRSAPGRALVTIFILATATAALYATRVIATETGQFIEGDPRSWLGADVVAEISTPATGEQLAAIANRRYTVSAECLTMVASEEAPDPAVVTLRAVDPSAYPFYGSVELEPPLPFREALTADAAVLTRGLFQRLHVSLGDRVRIGAAWFRVAGVLAIEPDRLSSIRSGYPRVMISRAGFERSRIALQQSYIAYRFLFRDAGIGLEELQGEVARIFPEATVSNYRRADPRVARVFDTVIGAFQLTAWSALLLGAIGAALLVYLHLERRLDTVAILKSLGASSAWIMRGYAAQSGALAIAGAVLGLPLGHLAARAIAAMERAQLALPVGGDWNSRNAGEAACAVVAASLLVTAVPLRRVREVRPLRLIRRFYREDQRGRRSANRMDTIGVALTFGVFLVAAPQAIRPVAVNEIAAALPRHSADLVVPGLRRDQAEELGALIRGIAGMELHPHAWVRAQGDDRRTAAACSAALGEDEALISEQYATLWQARAGSALALSGGGRKFRVRVQAVRPMDSLSHFRDGLTLSCRTFSWLNANYEAELRVSAEREASVVSMVQNAFPGIPVLRPREYEERMAMIARRSLNALQVISGLTLVCGATLLFTIIAGTYRQRMHEAAILKALGARRRRLAWMLALEFGRVGAVAGAIGGVLALGMVGGAEWIFLRKEAIDWAWWIPLQAILVTPVLAAGCGLAAVWPMLPKRPLELLREDG